MVVSECEFDANGDLAKSYQMAELSEIPCLVGGASQGSDWTVSKGVYSVKVCGTGIHSECWSKELIAGTGAAYTLLLQQPQINRIISYKHDVNISISIITDINSNDISILWIIPQFFIITLAQLLISITGLQFAYTQAPPSMKSVLTSFWLLCTSVGNMIVILVAETRFMPTQLSEYLFFAGVAFFADFVFVILAHFYDYVDEAEFDGFEYPHRMTGVKLKTELYEKGKTNPALHKTFSEITNS